MIYEHANKHKQDNDLIIYFECKIYEVNVKRIYCKFLEIKIDSMSV